MNTTKQEAEWIKRFQHIVSTCPKTLWLFTDDARNINVMRLRRGKPVMRPTPHYGVDPEYVVGRASGPIIDGGGF